MTRPCISIAMATYNGKRFIREQLDSIARQTLPPCEVVITDDQSTDGTVEAVKAFASSACFPVHVHRNEKRLWYRDNFFKAAALCKGDLIAFSDQDDVWHDDKLEKCSKALLDESVMLAVHSADMVDENLKPMGWRVPEIGHDTVTPPLKLGPGQLISAFAMVFRRNLPLFFATDRPWNSIERNGTMHHGQWAFFLARVFGRVVYMKESLALHRRHASTSTKPQNSPVGESVRKSAKVGKEQYIELARLREEWAGFLAASAASLEDESQEQKAKQAERHYRQVADVFRMRAGIYDRDNALIARMSSLLRVLACGGYGSRSRERLGFRSFAKDAVVGLRGSR